VLRVGRDGELEEAVLVDLGALEPSPRVVRARHVQVLPLELRGAYASAIIYVSILIWCALSNHVPE